MSSRRVPRWNGNNLAAILLDLDGTLLETADDIAVALNRALAEKKLAAIQVAEVRTLIGRGAPTLITRAIDRLAVQVDVQDQTELTERFYFHYDQLHVLNESSSHAYPGVADGLRGLHELGLRLAVVTNKQHHFAVALMQRLNLSQWIDVIVGGDSCERRKPDPQPLHFACNALHIEPAQALMVGDSVNDVRAARAAGLSVVCVPYGYNEGNDPRTLDCDALIESLADLPGMLLGDSSAQNSPLQTA